MASSSGIGQPVPADGETGTASEAGEAGRVAIDGTKRKANASKHKAMSYRLKLPKNRERYRKREQSVEPVFGQIKEASGQRQFLLRGLEKVSALWQPECAVHSRLKLYRANKRELEPAG